MWGETRLFRKPPIWRCNQPNAHLQGFFDCRVVVKGGKLCQNALARDRPISVTMGPCLHDSMRFFWRIGTYAYNFCKCSTVHPILAIWFIYLLTSLTKLPSRWENSRLPGTGFGRKTRSATSFNLTGKSSTCWTKCSLDFCDQWKGFKEHHTHLHQVAVTHYLCSSQGLHILKSI